VFARGPRVASAAFAASRPRRPCIGDDLAFDGEITFMTALPERRGILRTLAMAACLHAAAGCGESPPEPASEPPSQPAASIAPGGALAAGYAAAIAMLPPVEVETGSSWSGLTLDARGVGTRQSETDWSVAEIFATLETLQGPVETILALSDREDRFPPYADSEGMLVESGMKAGGDARNACRLLVSDAIRLFSLGQEEESARRLAACLGLVRQLCASDESAALVGVAIFGSTQDAALGMINGLSGRRMGPEARSIIRRSFDRLDRNAPFGPIETIAPLERAHFDRIMSQHRALQAALSR
jgi:hypothetical protein